MSWKAEYFVLFKLESGKFYISAASSITGQNTLSKYKLTGIENLETLGRSRSTITIKYDLILSRLSFIILPYLVYSGTKLLIPLALVPSLR